jgi:hypothetical protein
MPNRPDCCICSKPRRRPGLVGLVFNLALLYVMLVVGGGTLINTGHPVASEVGKLMHVVACVDPVIDWADSRDYDVLAAGLDTLSDGLPVDRYIG